MKKLLLCIFVMIYCNGCIFLIAEAIVGLGALAQTMKTYQYDCIDINGDYQCSGDESDENS